TTRSLRLTRRPRSHLHAREHLLPQRARETGRRSQVAVESRLRFRKTGHARRRRDSRSRRQVAGGKVEEVMWGVGSGEWGVGSGRMNDFEMIRTETYKQPRATGNSNSQLPTPHSLLPTPAYAIRVKDLWKRYGAVEAVRGVSLEVNEGEIFGLIGPDGAGKTTTFQILAG